MFSGCKIGVSGSQPRGILGTNPSRPMGTTLRSLMEDLIENQTIKPDMDLTP